MTTATQLWTHPLHLFHCLILKSTTMRPCHDMTWIPSGLNYASEFVLLTLRPLLQAPLVIIIIVKFASNKDPTVPFRINVMWPKGYIHANEMLTIQTCFTLLPSHIYRMQITCVYLILFLNKEKKNEDSYRLSAQFTNRKNKKIFFTLTCTCAVK